MKKENHHDVPRYIIYNFHNMTIFRDKGYTMSQARADSFVVDVVKN